jgi:hypothetical protein
VSSPSNLWSGYGFALLPSSDAREELRRFQEWACRDFPLVPKFGSESVLPHVTLFQGTMLRLLSVRDVLSDLRLALKTSPSPPVLRFDGVVYQPIGWLFLKVVPDPWIRDAQAHVVEGIASSIVVEAAGKDTSKYSAEERESFVQYGYRYVGSAFLPHITLGRGEATKIQQAESIIGEQWARIGPKQCEVSSVTFYRMGAEGSHEETVVEQMI